MGHMVNAYRSFRQKAIPAAPTPNGLFEFRSSRGSRWVFRSKHFMCANQKFNEWPSRLFYDVRSIVPVAGRYGIYVGP
jgi:hypothetical protein